MDINESQEERMKTLLIVFIKAQVYTQRYILNPVKHLRWKLLKIATKMWMCLCIVSTGVAFLTYILYIYTFKQNLSRRQNLIKCKEYNECKRNQKAFLTQSDKSVEQSLNLRRS